MTGRGLLELAVIATFGGGSSLVCERGRSISSPAAGVWDRWVALKRRSLRRHAVMLFEVMDVVWQTRLMLCLPLLLLAIERSDAPELVSELAKICRREDF